MNTQENEITNKILDQEAGIIISTHARQYAALLDYQARIEAHKRGDNRVLRSHVEEAVKILRRKQERRWSKELFIIIGSTFIGAFIPGFINELALNNDLFVVIYTILGFIGIAMVFFGLQS